MGIALGAPKHVTRIDPLTNTVTLGDHDDLLTQQVTAHKIRIRDVEWLTESPQVTARIRYKSPAVPASINFSSNELTLNFEQPVWGVTPGQSLVIYKDELLVGGGIIL